jgi:hypothetical protein
MKGKLFRIYTLLEREYKSGYFQVVFMPTDWALPLSMGARPDKFSISILCLSLSVYHYKQKGKNS